LVFFSENPLTKLPGEVVFDTFQPPERLSRSRLYLSVFGLPAGPVILRFPSGYLKLNHHSQPDYCFLRMQAFVEIPLFLFRGRDDPFKDLSLRLFQHFRQSVSILPMNSPWVTPGATPFHETEITIQGRLKHQ